MTAHDPLLDLDLARRAVACPRWRWLPGMVWWGQSYDPRNGRHWVEGRIPDRPVRGAEPNLTDPATQGCVMALLDDAYGDWWVEPSPGVDMTPVRWAVYVWDGSRTRRVAAGPTRIAALIAALECAP